VLVHQVRNNDILPISLDNKNCIFDEGNIDINTQGLVMTINMMLYSIFLSDCLWVNRLGVLVMARRFR
jgi:hypothetical protein